MLAQDDEDNPPGNWQHWGQHTLLEQLWEWAKQTLTTEVIINNLLLTAECKGRTAWYVAARSRNLEALNKVWD